MSADPSREPAADSAATKASAPAVPSAWTELLERSPVLMSSATGTELQRRGVPTPLPLWSAAALLGAPDAVVAVHRDSVAAGARIVTANTFRTNRHALAKGGIGDRAAELTSLAVELARQGAADANVDGNLLIAGSIGPVRDCYRPDLVPDGRALATEHAERARHLAAAGVGLVLVETMNRSREAVAALRACQAAGLHAAVSFVCTPGGRLLGGEALVDAASAVAAESPLALLVNCSSPTVANEALVALRACSTIDVPLGVYANGSGAPEEEFGWTFLGGVGRSAWVAAARDAVLSGARLVGGCCGTSPDWIATLHDELTGLCDGHRQELAGAMYPLARHALETHGTLTPFGALVRADGTMLRVEPGEHVVKQRERAIESIRDAIASQSQESTTVAAAVCTEVQLEHEGSYDRPFAIRLHIESRAGPPIDVVQPYSHRADGSTHYGESSAAESSRQLLR